MELSAQPTCPLPNEAIVSAAMMALGNADLHAKTTKSIAQAVLGLVHSPRLSITAIGTAWARITGHKAKHGVKQVDHLVGSDTFDVADDFWELAHGRVLCENGRRWRNGRPRRKLSRA